MDFTTITSFFGQAVPLFVVGLVVHQVYMANEIKHIRKDLSNHITDTNKKIDNLRQDMNVLRQDMDKKIDNLRQDMNVLRQDMKESFNNINHKLDKALQR